MLARSDGVATGFGAAAGRSGCLCSVGAVVRATGVGLTSAARGGGAIDAFAGAGVAAFGLTGCPLGKAGAAFSVFRAVGNARASGFLSAGTEARAWAVVLGSEERAGCAEVCVSGTAGDFKAGAGGSDVRICGGARDFETGAGCPGACASDGAEGSERGASCAGVCLSSTACSRESASGRSGVCKFVSCWR